MALKNIFSVTSGTKKVITTMLLLTVIGVVVAYFYYDSINSEEDPRIVEAKKLVSKYNKLMDEKKYSFAFEVLNQQEAIYKSVPGYEKSYEIGVIHNNRTAIYLLMAIYEALDENDKKKNLELSKDYTQKAMAIYNDWLKSIGKLTREEIHIRTVPYFKKDDTAFKGLDLEKIIKRRVDDIVLSQIETKRRLSVSYTNLGIIQRHQNKPEDALVSYNKALELWSYNHTAKNNLRLLVGQKTEKRNIIDQLFPPDRKKDDIHDTDIIE